MSETVGRKKRINAPAGGTSAKPASGKVLAAKAGRRSARLSPDERRRQILDGAIAYFSEAGFDGSTRELARRLGVTQPLLYRYFPTKDHLIAEVYDALYVGRWRDEWLEILAENAPLEDRLCRFYARYTDVIYDRTWIRIYLFSGLRNLPINRWWIQFVEQTIMRRVVGEIRREAGLPAPADFEPSQAESDAFWMFHGGIFYWGVRSGVYSAPIGGARDAFIATSVRTFLNGLPALLKR